MHLWRLDDLFQLDYIYWLHRLIRACSSPNKTLETFIIRVQYSNEAVELEEAWEDVFYSLLDNVFPSLKTLTVLITADEGRDVTSWVNWFNRSKYVRKLRSKRDIDVEVLAKTDLGKFIRHVALEIPDKQSRKPTSITVCQRCTMGMCCLWQ